MEEEEEEEEDSMVVAVSERNLRMTQEGVEVFGGTVLKKTFLSHFVTVVCPDRSKCCQ